ncbi:MAG: hypothetical protein ABIR96_05110 [Bdellovibrionota bacterium]
MTKNILILATFASTLSFAGERIVRSFDCKANYKDSSSQTGSFTATLVDIAQPNEDFPGEEKSISRLEFTANFVPADKAQLATEARDEDIEGVRDDDPSGRSGWGGSAFYMQITKGTEEAPIEALVLMTKADREQQGQKLRSYEFQIDKRSFETATPDADEKVDLLAQGRLVCTQR